MARSVSCTIMAYNEEATLAEATDDVVAALRGFGDRAFEVLIVDDGSTDRSAEIGRELELRHPEVRLIRHGQNRGPGSALLTGFAESKHEVICFHAADQQLPFAEVAALIPLLDEVDLVIGDRTARPGYTPLRRLSSHVYIGLVQRLFGLRAYRDFNFLYLYRKQLLDRIAQAGIETTGVFMPTEVLVKAVDLGARIAPATVTCLPREHGVATCGRPSVILHTLREMLRFWGLWRLRHAGLL
jgi:glycosyltransferase involved in cell wall biosynthesis